MTKEKEELEVELVIEEVRISEHGRHGRKPPRAHRYLLDIDGTEHVVHQHGMIATGILDLVGKGPEDWALELLLHDGERVRCEPGDMIVFSERLLIAFETWRLHGDHGHHHDHHHHHHHHDGPQPTPPEPAPPEPCPPVPAPPTTFVLNIVVNGEVVHPDATPHTLLSAVVVEALDLAKAVGRADSHWELRLNGNLLNQNLTIAAAHVPDGATLYLSLAAGAAGDGGLLADPDVSRAKFAAEVAKYRKVEKDLIKRGQWLLEAEWPEAFAVFAAPIRGAPALVPFGVVLNFENYDFVPPSVRMVDPITRTPFKYKELPIAAHLAQYVKLGVLPDGRPHFAQQALMQAHHPNDVPFLCLPGVREYHEHPAHTGDDWLAHRGGGGIEGSLYHLLDVIYLNGTKNVSGLQTQVVLQVPAS